MSIHWEIYRRVPEFKLLEAALLWLEIEPSEELLASPPYGCQKLQQTLNDALDDIEAQELIQSAEEAAKKQGITKVDILKRLFSSPPPREPNQRFFPGVPTELFPTKLDNGERVYEVVPARPPWLLPGKRGRKGRAYELVEIFGIDSKSLTESSWESLTRDWCTNSDLERIVSRDRLIKVAEAWNESPKFLFSEERVNPISDDGFEKGKVSKSSYQELIKILAHALSIDLMKKEAVGAIKIKAQLAEIEISDTTVRKVLNEIHTSRLKNNNRKNKKTK